MKGGLKEVVPRKCGAERRITRGIGSLFRSEKRSEFSVRVTSSSISIREKEMKNLTSNGHETHLHRGGGKQLFCERGWDEVR